MVNQLLVSLVNSILGTGKPTARGNYAYHCPECSHHKPKLEICLDETSENYQKYGCWVCSFKGKKLTTLFKKLNVDVTKLYELNSLLKTNYNLESQEVFHQKLILPKEFTPLVNPNLNNISTKHALNFLKKRKITNEDIIKYNLGYCEKGKYANRIIIPSYNENGELNYFTTRSFIDKSYQNPSVSRNIIAFEFFINWNSPIILCEGMFDAMTIKRNAIPLLGKNIQDSLMKKIVESKVNKIYIALDKDAMKNTLRHCETFLNEGKKVYLIELTEKDPNELGFEKFTRLIHSAEILTFSNLLEKKLNTI